MLSKLVIWMLHGLGYLPLSWLRALGAGLGVALLWLIPSRRRVVQTNLRVCFPHLTPAQRNVLVRQTFVYFTQAWLDRGWLWHRSAACVQARLHITGDVASLLTGEPTVLFAPHFVGLDAGAAALMLNLQLTLTTIFMPQSNAVMDDWVSRGRERFGKVRLFRREDGIKPVVSALRQGAMLYLLPDMNFGPSESIFVPFYGVPAATVPSLSRFAKLGRARVIPLTTRMTDSGYDVQVHPAWTDFPTDDVQADTATMNRRLEGFINTMPAQYFWVHKRFKTRPEGAPNFY